VKKLISIRLEHHPYPATEKAYHLVNEIRRQKPSANNQLIFSGQTSSVEGRYKVPLFSIVAPDFMKPCPRIA
jgi:hypothetical protein